MYDKTVRRRRAVLALLVALSLILLTAYFGEAQSGGLHSLQSGFLTVVSPIQDGANKALKPVRDLFGWFGSTLRRQGPEQGAAQAAQPHAREQLTANAVERTRGSTRELLKLDHLNTTLSIADYHPVSATVVYQSPNIWYSTDRSSTRAPPRGCVSTTPSSTAKGSLARSRGSPPTARS